MNAVIVDIRKKQAAALDETGRVVRIPNANYEIGQTIELHEVKPVRTPTMLKRLSTGVAAAVLVAMIGTGTAYAMPYGTVTLDGDASVEYTINCFDYVLDVKGTNEEGEALLVEMDTRQLRHHRIDTAVGTTVEHMEQRGDFEREKVEIRIEADTRNDKHSDRLRQELRPVVEFDLHQEESAPNDPSNSDWPEPPDMPHEQAENQPPHPAEIPNQDVNAELPHPENEDSMAASEEYPSHGFSAPMIGGDPHSSQDSSENAPIDPNEGFTPAEQSGMAVPEEIEMH